MNLLPLCDASMSEVLARVAFRTIHYFHRRYFLPNNPPLSVMSQVGDILYEQDLTQLAVWVWSYRRQWSPIYTTHAIRENFILDARRGYSWRRVVFSDYKSNRRSDPRVTNRGVAKSERSGETQ